MWTVYWAAIALAFVSAMTSGIMASVLVYRILCGKDEGRRTEK